MLYNRLIINISKFIVSYINNQTIIYPIWFQRWFFMSFITENVRSSIIIETGRINPIFENWKYFEW